MASRRKEIVQYIVGQLKNIDGQSSTYDASYTYNNNLFENVFRKLKFLDEVNDFPAVMYQLSRVSHNMIGGSESYM